MPRLTHPNALEFTKIYGDFKNHKCAACKSKIDAGSDFWVLGSPLTKRKYLKNRLIRCSKCVGFILSRYSFVNIHGEIGNMDRQWQEHFDQEWLAKCGWG